MVIDVFSQVRRCVLLARRREDRGGTNKTIKGIQAPFMLASSSERRIRMFLSNLNMGFASFLLLVAPYVTTTEGQSGPLPAEQWVAPPESCKIEGPWVAWGVVRVCDGGPTIDESLSTRVLKG